MPTPSCCCTSTRCAAIPSCGGRAPGSSPRSSPAAGPRSRSRYLSHDDEDRYFRMTTSYWELVGTLVNRGVLHAELFFDHTGEDIVTLGPVHVLDRRRRAPTCGRPTSTSSSDWSRPISALPRAHHRRVPGGAARTAKAAGHRDASVPDALKRCPLRFGRLFVVTTFGESHGPGVGVVVDGMPPGVAVDVGRDPAASWTAGVPGRARSRRSARKADRSRSSPASSRA